MGARSNWLSYRTAFDLAQQQQAEVLPLAKLMQEETVYRYNGMFMSVWQLLAQAIHQFAIFSMDKTAPFINPVLPQVGQCALQRKKFFKHYPSFGPLHCRPLGGKVNFFKRRMARNQLIRLQYRLWHRFPPGDRVVDCFGNQFSQYPRTYSLR